MVGCAFGMVSDCIVVLRVSVYGDVAFEMDGRDKVTLIVLGFINSE